MEKHHTKSSQLNIKPIYAALAVALGCFLIFALTAIAEPQKNTTIDTLPEVEANADAGPPAGHVNGYVAKRNVTASKTDTPLIEVPQSVSVITSDQMEDRKAQTLQEILRYSAGVVADQYGLDLRSDNYSVRGMDTVQYINGLRGLNNYYTGTTHARTPMHWSA